MVRHFRKKVKNPCKIYCKILRKLMQQRQLILDRIQILIEYFTRCLFNELWREIKENVL